MANIRTSGVFSLGSLGGDVAGSTGDWGDVTLQLDGSSTTDLTGLSTITPSTSGYTTNNTGPDAKFNQYIDFQNSGYLDVALPSALGASNEPFTVETWAYFDSSSNDGVFQLLRSGNTLNSNQAASNSLAIAVVSGQMRAYNESSAVDNLGALGAAWYHLALTSDGTTLRWYIDGIMKHQINISSTSVDPNGYPNIAIGGYYSDGNVMDGRIEGFRVTKGVARYTTNFNTDDVIANPAAWPTVDPVAAATKPTRRWGGITGRSLLAEGSAGTSYSKWIDRIGSETLTETGGVIAVTSDPEHKSFADGAYINFSGGSTTADMRVQFRFRRDSGATSYEGVYTRESGSSGQAGSIWTQGGSFAVYDTGWKLAQYTPTTIYDTWFWVDVQHSGTSMTLTIYDEGTEDTVGTQLYTNTYTLGTATGDYATVRLMAGWQNASYAGNGDLGVVRYNVGATDENWTSEFYPYNSIVGYIPASVPTTGRVTLLEHYQSKL